MDDMTQQNAALVEQAAAAAGSLHEKAQSLAALISRFRINGQMLRQAIPRVEQSPVERIGRAPRYAVRQSSEHLSRLSTELIHPAVEATERHPALASAHQLAE